MVTFNNIPTTIRLPGQYTEVDNSRALQGTALNPHKVLLLGQKTSDGTAATGELKQITSELIGNGFFGSKSVLGRMCRKFKQANPYTQVFAIALDSAGGVQASANIRLSQALSHYSVVSTSNEILHFAVNGDNVAVTLENGWSVADVNSAIVDAVNDLPYCPVVASVISTSSLVKLTAVNSGTLGNTIDIRFNSRTGEEYPACFGDSVILSAFVGGSSDPDVDAAWSVISNEQYHYIVSPYSDSTNLDMLDTELATRFGPMEDKQGHALTAFKGTYGSSSTQGKLENSPFISILAYYNGQQSQDEWAAVFAAICSYYLNDDPARPLQTLKLPGLIAPAVVDRFSNDERNLLLYDGISTWNVDANGNVVLERVITTYRTDAIGNVDPSYLNIETMATLSEIRYQYKLRMYNRFMSQRFKLADDSFPVQPGTKVATPKTIRQEIVALFNELQDKGLIENLEEFTENLVVERDSTDRDRVNVLLPPDLINQFRILATQIQFIL